MPGVPGQPEGSPCDALRHSGGEPWGVLGVPWAPPWGNPEVTPGRFWGDLTETGGQSWDILGYVWIILVGNPGVCLDNAVRPWWVILGYPGG